MTTFLVKRTTKDASKKKEPASPDREKNIYIKQKLPMAAK